jgi:hypothetical protein
MALPCRGSEHAAAALKAAKASAKIALGRRPLASDRVERQTGPLPR